MPSSETISCLEINANEKERTLEHDMNESSFDQLLSAKSSLVQSCFYQDQMAVEGRQHFLRDDFLNALSSLIGPSDSHFEEGGKVEKSAVTLMGSGDFFTRMNLHNDQYLHFIDAIEEHTFDVDDDSLMAQRDLQRLETKLDVLMRLLARQTQLNETNTRSSLNSLPFTFTVSPQHFKLSLNLTQLLTLQDSSIDDLEHFAEQLKSVLCCGEYFIFGLELNPLLHQKLTVAVQFSNVFVDSVGADLLFEATLVKTEEASLEAFEKYIFRLHRRQLASNRQQRK